jgi:hypothetical protein
MTRVRTADGRPDDARLVVDYGPVNPPPTAAPGDDGWRTNADAGPAALESLERNYDLEPPEWYVANVSGTLVCGIPDVTFWLDSVERLEFHLEGKLSGLAVAVITGIMTDGRDVRHDGPFPYFAMRTRAANVWPVVADKAQVVGPLELRMGNDALYEIVSMRGRAVGVLDEKETT